VKKKRSKLYKTREFVILLRESLDKVKEFSLGRVMAKLSHTSQTAIAITFLVMNLSTHLSRVFYAFFCLFFKNKPFLAIDII
jgi:hypothetical protein